MSIVLDSDTLVNLAKYINKGWPNLYQATVEDKHYMFETIDGNGVNQYRHVNGRLVVRYIPERTSNEPQYHFAAVELCGEITSLEGDVANVEPSSLRLTSTANRGLIKTTNDETSRDIVNYQVQILKERKSHFIQPPGSYCDIPHMFPIEWVTLQHPWQSNPEFVDFTIIGGTTLTQADINSIPAVEDLNEFSRWVVDLVRPIDSFFDEDSLYMDYHQKGLIDDSYRSSTKEW